ncbi:SusD/RagB family nutrient-binding outer membrane lipoprotein [Rufibacter hautae]|uniref:SusD/RagB family nutrient-binding outer membrane lipoprotein n=1 Tax=Rufibacter hautae TaxID=2595005 RepID=A0A5B6TJ76_9BACT|nr:SusD/RagB family nutrient-binding outer membrane lipoprotein [Rufibacter hautae]KAA3440086.1 SusD/RagB family nutrient-binding outer membrane lipoprotein [Rufibacter hautae]
MKSTYKKIRLLLCGLLLLSLGSCDNFEEMNQNPTKSTQMDPNLMLPTIQLQLSGGMYEQWRNGFIYAGDWMQQWTGEYATTEFGGKGQKNDGYMSALWDTQYPREVKNISDMVIRTTGDPAQVNINAVSRIMKVYIFSRLTDLYGDLPYFEAGKGYHEGVLTPKYDAQKDIYYDFFKELDAATKALTPAGDPVTQDFYFNGDVNKWRKFGNSLRLRLAMRLVKVEPAKAREEAEAAIAAGVMESNSDMAVMQHINVPFGGDVFGGNGFSYVLMAVSPTESAFRMVNTFAKYLEDTSDPRLRIFGASYLKDENRTEITDQVRGKLGSYTAMSLPPSTFSYEGTGPAITVDVNGQATEVPRILQVLQPSKYISAIDAPYIIMSYAEVELWRAEAAVRGWNSGGTAQDHFNKALEAGVKQMTVYKAPEVPQATINAFKAANPLLPGQELEQINTQLWINFALNPQEGYANWRRTGLPNLTYRNRDPGVNQSGGQVPRRMQYPVNEYLLNEANVKEAAARITGGDVWTARVWWDK